MDAPEFVAPAEVPLPGVAPGLVVRPADVGQIARLLAVAAPLVTTLLELPDGLVQRLQGSGLPPIERDVEGDSADASDALDSGPTMADILDLFEVLSRHPYKLIEMVAIATRLDRAVVEALAPDRFAFLFAVVVQVNADFFSRATPAFAAAGRVLEQVKARAHVTPGPALSTS